MTSITVIVPLLFNFAFRWNNAPIGFFRCSSTKQTNMWSKLLSKKGKSKMSALRKAAFSYPADSIRAFAVLRDVSVISIHVKWVSGLWVTKEIVWAPTPHPTSNTEAPGGYLVSLCSNSVRVVAWSTSLSFSLSEYPWTYLCSQVLIGFPLWVFTVLFKTGATRPQTYRCIVFRRLRFDKKKLR